MTAIRQNDTADELRDALTDRLRTENVIRSASVEAAIRRTPRHLFIPDVELDQAYADNPVYTKTDAAGASISAASQPRIVAMMLEQLAARPGERILEIGAGTGYNAALIAAMVGDAGHVTTIDVDADLVDGARRHLTAAGVGNVDVVLGDGARGHPGAAPYDRIIATVGAWETPTAWLEQLAPDGRLVVPLRLRGAASRSIVFQRHSGGWRSQGSELAVFMPLRGIGDDARRTITLTPEQDVTLQAHKEQAIDQALAGVLDTNRTVVWTGVLFPAPYPGRLILLRAREQEFGTSGLLTVFSRRRRGTRPGVGAGYSAAENAPFRCWTRTTRPCLQPPSVELDLPSKAGLVHLPASSQRGKRSSDRVGRHRRRRRRGLRRTRRRAAPATGN